MPLDVNVFDKLKSFQDYQKADQAFQLQKALTTQQIQTGGIDAASKANVFATQVLSSATDQASYDKAKSLLSGYGIDTSPWASDFQTGQQQAYQARWAQSPLGTLFNAQQKIIGNNIAGTSAMGTTDNQFTQPVPSINPLTGQVTVTPQVQPKPVPQPVAIGNAQVFDQPVTAPPAQNSSPTPTQPVTLQSPNQAPPFVPPLRDPNGTQAAYQQKYQQALEAWKVDPRVIASLAKAGALGKDQADAEKSAVGASANYDQVVQTINGIKDLVNSPAGLPEDRYGVPAKGKAWLNQNFGDQQLANNANTFTKLNEAQTIGAIKELASTGQIRMTRTLENILNRGYLIDPGASDAGKTQQADVILAELNNSKIAAQNVNAGLNGGTPQPYQAMPTSVSTPAPKVANGTIADNPQTGESLIFMDGAWKPLRGR